MAVAEEAGRIGREGVDEALFQRLKRASYGGLVRALNSFETLCIELTTSHFQGHDYLEFPQIFDEIGREDIEACIRQMTRPHGNTLAVIWPKGERK